MTRLQIFLWVIFFSIIILYGVWSIIPSGGGAFYPFGMYISRFLYGPVKPSYFLIPIVFIEYFLSKMAKEKSDINSQKQTHPKA